MLYIEVHSRFFDIIFRVIIFLLFFVLSIQSFAFSWKYQEELRSDIFFWKNIFTRYSTDQVIIHDSENLNIIYKVVTFDSSLSQKDRIEQIKKIKKEIKESLLKLAEKDKTYSKLERFKTYLQRLAGDTLSPEFLKQAAKTIRAQNGMREQFMEGVKRSLAYLPYIQQIFQEHGLPTELAYLPHVESSFNPLARSHAGATGMWQFMRSTARLYMKVNRIIDQRYDPFVSTRAAAKLLKYNYQQTGDWALAITAYNFGLAGIKKAIRQVGLDYLKVREAFKHRRFGFASRNFYPEFLAVVEIMNNLDRYFPGIEPITLPPKIRYQLKRSVYLNRLAKLLGLNIKDLKELNPEYTYRCWKGWVSVPAGYWINLPLDADLTKLEPSHQSLLANVSALSSGKSSSKEKTNEMAKADQLLNRNLLSNPGSFSTVIEHQKPNVHEGPVTVLSDKVNLDFNMISKSEVNPKLYSQIKQEIVSQLLIKGDVAIVFANETLGHYAEWLEIPLTELKRINRLKNSRRIYQGQKLKLSFQNVTKDEFQKRRINFHLKNFQNFIKNKKIARLDEYKVNIGDSVWELAVNRFGIPIQIIQYFNSLHDINKLKPGDKLKIPVFQTNYSLEETL